MRAAGGLGAGAVVLRRELRAQIDHQSCGLPMEFAARRELSRHERPLLPLCTERIGACTVACKTTAALGAGSRFFGPEKQASHLCRNLQLWHAPWRHCLALPVRCVRASGAPRSGLPSCRQYVVTPPATR